MSYWSNRKNYTYYDYVKKICTDLIGVDSSIIDFGCRDTEIIFDLSCKNKYLLDIENIYSKSQRNRIQELKIIFLQEDIYHIQYFNRFDISLCLQTLEHLDDPPTAFKKIFDATTKYIIISLPYKWQYCKYHKHHMIDENQIFIWTNLKPYITKIISDDSIERIVNIYKKDNS